MGGDRPNPKKTELSGGSEATCTLSEQSALTDPHSNALLKLERSRPGTAQTTALQLVEAGAASQVDQTAKQGHDATKAAEKGEEVIKGKGGETVRETPEGKYFVTGPDGKEREYVQSDKYVQTPGKPNRWPFDGGAIDNQSDKPVLVLGKGVGHPENEHGDGYLRLLPPHTKTDGSATDYDGIVTDKRFQPVVLPNGKVLMPAQVDGDAQWLKVPDRDTGVITKDGRVYDQRALLPPHGETGTFPIEEYTGGRPVKPETHETRKRDEDAEAHKHH